MARNTFLPHGINKRLMFASDVLRIGGVVQGVIGHTVREF